MNIYISLDMEGIPGTYNWEQEKENRAAVKTHMQQHLSDVVEAIISSNKNAEIEEITVADSHSDGNNIDYSFTALDKRINLISGNPRPHYMMPAFSNHYDQVFLIGYHAGTGALKGNMDHSYSNKRVHKIWMNGIRMNEALINSAYAGYHGVPVTLVTGDKALSRELLAEQAMSWINYVITKEAIAKFSAINYSSAAVRERTIEAVHKALSVRKCDYSLYRFDSPIMLKMELVSTSMADVVCLMPEVKRLDGRTIEYQNDDYAVMFEAVMAIVTLASAANIS